MLISGHIQLSPKGGDKFHSLIYLCFRNNKNVKTGQFTHTPKTNQNKTTATRNKTFHAKGPYVHPGMELENSETSKKHNNNLLWEQQMSIVLNSSNIYPPVGIFWKTIFSHGKKVDTRPYIIRNSVSEHPYKNQAGYGFKKEDSAGLLKIFQNKKEKISVSVYVREAETKISVI